LVHLGLLLLSLVGFGVPLLVLLVHWSRTPFGDGLLVRIRFHVRLSGFLASNRRVLGTALRSMVRTNLYLHDFASPAMVLWFKKMLATPFSF